MIERRKTFSFGGEVKREVWNSKWVDGFDTPRRTGPKLAVSWQLGHGLDVCLYRVFSSCWNNVMREYYVWARIVQVMTWKVLPEGASEHGSWFCRIM